MAFVLGIELPEFTAQKQVTGNDKNSETMSWQKCGSTCTPTQPDLSVHSSPGLEIDDALRQAVRTPETLPATAAAEALAD